MASSRLVKVGLLQMQCASETKQNLARAVEMIREAASQGASIICLPELFQSHYFCQTEDHTHFDLAETVPGPTTEVFSPLAKELGVVLIASLFEKRTEGR